MTRLFRAAAVVLATAAAPAVLPESAAAQPGDPPPRVDEARVRAALRSPEALWRFVTSPETRWTDRIAAAYRAYPADRRPPAGERRQPWTDFYGDAPAPPRFALSMEYYPRVMAARRELRRERGIHRWGLVPPGPPPGSRMASIVREPYDFGGQKRRIVLGHVWLVPDSASDAEARRSPWPAQVEQALDVLHKGFHDTSSPDEFFAAALRLPCATGDDAESLLLETRSFASAARMVTPAIAGAWRNAALNRAWPDIRSYVNLEFYALGISRSEEAFWLGQALMVDMAGSATDEEIPMLVIHLMWQDTDERPGWEIRRPGMPDASIWALARRVDALPPAIEPYRRADAGRDVMEVADSAAAAALPRAMQTDSIGNEETFAAYRAWFAARRGELSRRAALQEPRVSAARREMARTTVCAGR
jgi:hypothetical protein